MELKSRKHCWLVKEIESPIDENAVRITTVFQNYFAVFGVSRKSITFEEFYAVVFIYVLS